MPIHDMEVFYHGSDKKVEIDGQKVEFRASAAVLRMYQLKFGRDIYKDLKKSLGDNDEDKSSFDLFRLELFENIAYIMAKNVDPKGVPSVPEEWLRAERADAGGCEKNSQK